jgi:hypothetical protein
MKSWQESYLRDGQNLRVRVLFDAEAQDRLASELAREGRAPSLGLSATWGRMHGALWSLAVEDEGGRVLSATNFVVTRTRALPGHVVLRAERIGHGSSELALGLAVEAITELCRLRGDVLRLEVATFALDSQTRAHTSQLFSGLGFRLVADPRHYVRTSIIDLTPPEAQLLAGFHGTARRHIRAVAKHPVELLPITDPALAPALQALLEQTMARTGGGERTRPWVERIAFARDNPGLLHFVGLFRRDSRELLAWTSGQRHGDCVIYAEAASSRPRDLRLPLGYALAWQVMRWAKEGGARWFDFGGITDGTHDDDDPVGGISDFKRYFRGDERWVCDEWHYEPRPLRAAVAHALSGAANWWRARGAAPLRRADAP